MRVALVDNVLLDPASRGDALELQPHLGLLALVAALRGAGHDAVLHDPKLDVARGATPVRPGFAEATAERIAALGADLVGFTTLGCNFATTIGIVRALRRRAPAIPIVLGGPHASILDRQIMARYGEVDAVVRGEADETIAGVVAAFAGRAPFAEARGLSYRCDGGVARTADAPAIRDLDALPFPAYDAYPIAELGLATLRVDAGRGCPFACTFCSTATFFGRLYRLKSSGRLVDELDRLAATYGIRKFTLNHDLFTVDAKRVRAFCEAVADRDYRWTCSARIDCVDDGLLATMARAGCDGIYYGIETGSPRLQRAVEKRLDLELYHPRIARTLALGMAATASFIVGYPQEAEADQDATLALAGESLARYGSELDVQLHLLAPEPGTGLHARYGAALGYDGYVSDFVFPPIEPGEAEAVAGDPAVFVCQHYYLGGVTRERTVAAVAGFRAIRALGREIARALMRGSDSFADLVRDVGARCASGDATAAGAAALVACARARLGDDSPAADLVRFGAAVASLRSERRSRASVADPDAAIALARSTRALAPIRDPRAVLAADDERGASALPRAPLLLLGASDGSGYDLFPIDATTFAVARRLETPTTPAAVLAAFAPLDVRARLRTLALLGAVVDASGDYRGGRQIVNSAAISEL